MKSVRWMVSYIIVASLGLWLAFAVSMKFMAPAHSQTAPSNGDLPPEFMKEVENTQVPAPGTTAQPQVPPPPPPPGQPAQTAQPAAPPVQPPHQDATVPPPPPDMQMGDAVTAPNSDVLPKDDYVYDPTGKRDPFKPFRVIRVSSRKEVPVEQLEPLQRWDLDRLQIVGILWDVGRPRAMIRDPDGTVYTIIKNSKIGRNEGYVSAIREGEIVVVETKYDEDKAIKETRVIEFKK
ncbi:MAG: pilus assembly protein PilP [Bdellovibrio sp.]|nr:pilus assembly protein PilP [Bdellovibrio sp.]